jgi:hypothetical protein
MIFDTGQPNSAMESKGEREPPCKLKMIPFCFPSDPFLYIFSLFSRREGGRETERYRAGGCRLHKSYQAGFIAPQHCN